MAVIKKVLYLFLLFVCCGILQAQVVDFDAEYGTGHTGYGLVLKIIQAVEAVDEGGTILFKSAEYDFEGSALNLLTAVTLKGLDPNGIDPNVAGAQNVAVKFKNLLRLNIRSSNFTISNLELIADDATGYFVRICHISYNNTNVAEFYENIVMDNVIFRGGSAQIFGGNGAGVTFSHCSFLEFSYNGYLLDRKGRVDYNPGSLISSCLFVPDFNDMNYNTRGVSFDAGNDEYPVVWDQNWTHIKDCVLDGTGLGISSKCQKVKVTGCHFFGRSKYNDMIHIEEFGSDFIIDDNIFEHVTPSRTIYIDRAGTPCHDIQITNNKFVGEYFWIIWSLSPYDLVFANNDFSQAWAEDPNYLTIDMTNLHSGEYETLPYELPATGILFRNNTGLDGETHGIFAYNAIEDDASIDIDYPVDKIQKNVVEELPKSIINLNKSYRIRNKQSGEFVVSVAGDEKLGLIEGISEDAFDVWQFEFKYPYYYQIKNVGTGNYMEVYKGYTLGDYANPNPPEIFVEQKYSYEGKVAIPIFYLRGYLDDGETYYEFLPGGNERKSRFIKVDGNVELEFARDGASVPLPVSDDSSWELMEYGFGSYLTFDEFAVFGEQWLRSDCNISNDYCFGVDIDQSQNVDFNDLMLFTEYWLGGR